MSDRAILVFAVFLVALVFVSIRSCYDPGKEVVTETRVDTIRVSDTVVVNRFRRDTFNSVLVDSVPVVYWDTVYRDTVYRYVHRMVDSIVNIENMIIAGGKVYESKLTYEICVPERIVTNTVTVNRVEKSYIYRSGLYLGASVGYPLNIGGVVGWQFKNGSMLFAQKSFLSPEKFEVCLVSPVFKK